MQLKDFYIVNNLAIADNKVLANITLNKNHDVFKGHFPGNPVTPGVCMMQIITELTEQVVSEKLYMQSSSNIKFSAIINPEVNSDLVLQIDITKTTNGYKVTNVTTFDDTIALKLTSFYLVVDNTQ